MFEFIIKNSNTAKKIHASIELVCKIMGEFVNLNVSLVKELEIQRQAINNLVTILEFIIKNDPKYAELFKENNIKNDDLN